MRKFNAVSYYNPSSFILLGVLVPLLWSCIASIYTVFLAGNIVRIKCNMSFLFSYDYMLNSLSNNINIIYYFITFILNSPLGFLSIRRVLTLKVLHILSSGGEKEEKKTKISSCENMSIKTL